MSPNDYQKFQQRMFDQIEELDLEYKQRVINEFILDGLRVGIDVISEFVNNHKSVEDIRALIQNARQAKSHLR